ncbi:MAG: phosphoribosylaminoimidazolesuccinocarboxamide synthase [Syntrophales bacterium]|nr:phosphoribosylaminoimidazolesuccinocarboxamide synthase [Syntrophales bacterium]
MDEVLMMTDFPHLKKKGSGKVRDLYEVDSHLLIVATDRISAFDVVMPNPIPGKGRILTEMSAFWFKRMEDIVEHHLITTDVDLFPNPCRPYREILRGRSMLVKKAVPLPVEFIVRGYLAGSGWKDYLRYGSISGVKLPPGLKESAKLPEPILTPTTKAQEGQHDVPITKDEMVAMIGIEIAEIIESKALEIYKRAAAYAEKAGIIVADTKMEFGLFEGRVILIDELLTPDSSRFWSVETYEEGRPQVSFDKQYLRDYLLSLSWDQRPPAPELPLEVIRKTAEKYREVLHRLLSL